jgi:hypothetical protein
VPYLLTSSSKVADFFPFLETFISRCSSAAYRNYQIGVIFFYAYVWSGFRVILSSLNISLFQRMLAIRFSKMVCGKYNFHKNSIVVVAAAAAVAVPVTAGIVVVVVVVETVTIAVAALVSSSRGTPWRTALDKLTAARSARQKKKSAFYRNEMLIAVFSRTCHRTACIQPTSQRLLLACLARYLVTVWHTITNL